MAREVATVFYVQRLKHLKRQQQRLRRVSRMAVMMQPLDQGLLPDDAIAAPRHVL